MEESVMPIEPANEETAPAQQPTCPKCGSTEFRHWPIGSIPLRCDSCHDQFDPSDLVGERFEYLKAEYLK